MRIESNAPSTDAGGQTGYVHRLGEPLPPLKERKPPRKKSPAEFAAIQERAYRLGADTRAALAVELGVSVDSLERLGVGRWYDDYRNLHCSVWPEWSPAGEITGMVRRYESAVNEDGQTKLSMRGGTPGVYRGAGWESNPGPVYVVEGGSDTAALLTLGLCVVGRPSCVGGVSLITDMVRSMGDRRTVVVVAERDEKPERIGAKGCRGKRCPACMECWPGLAGARRVASALHKALQRPTWVALPAAKDARAWLMQNRGATWQEWRLSLTVDRAPIRRLRG